MIVGFDLTNTGARDGDEVRADLDAIRFLPERREGVPVDHGLGDQGVGPRHFQDGVRRGVAGQDQSLRQFDGAGEEGQADFFSCGIKIKLSANFAMVTFLCFFKCEQICFKFFFS